MISNNVMKQCEFNDLVLYRVGCACTSPYCDMTLALELLEDVGTIELTIDSNLSWRDFHNVNNWTWYRLLWNRIKTAIKIIFKGKIEMSSGLVIQEVEHLQSFINALEEGIKHLENFKRGNVPKS